jgi:LmbE family N-acetylglucosaminyl deacetylase
VVPAAAIATLGDRAPASYGSPDGTDTLTLELGELAQVKLDAIRRHVSQTGSAGPFHDWRPEVRDAYLGTEHYRLARSNLPVPAGGGGVATESGLWDGLA